MRLTSRQLYDLCRGAQQRIANECNQTIPADPILMVQYLRPSTLAIMLFELIELEGTTEYGDRYIQLLNAETLVRAMGAALTDPAYFSNLVNKSRPDADYDLAPPFDQELATRLNTIINMGDRRVYPDLSWLARFPRR